MGTIKTLGQLKERLKLTPESNFEKEFKEIADALFNNFVISKGGRKFRFVEIEFYHSKTEKAPITYTRTAPAGTWFFHQSGADLTFESEGDCYGGILIRAIRELCPDSHAVCGPYKVMDLLFDQFNAFATPDNFPYVEEASGILTEVIPEQPEARWNLDKEKWGKDGDAAFRYFLPETEWNIERPIKYTAYPFKKKK